MESAKDISISCDNPDEANAMPISKNDTSSNSNLYSLLEIEIIDADGRAKNELSMKNNKLLRVDESGEIHEKRCEYARNQMKKYRLKMKADPVRYSAYLKKERTRSRKRKEQKILKLAGSGRTLKEARKILKIRSLPREIKTKTSNPIRGHICINTQQSKPINLASDCPSKSVNIIESNVNEEPEEWVDYEECSNDIEEDIKYNRICGVITCPSRLSQNLVVNYYPIPANKNIRDIWFKSIKSKTKQSEIDPDSFICSLHFAPEWFEVDEIYDEEILSPVAVPTLFPESQIYSQFNTKIPIMFDEHLNNTVLFKNYYEWSSAKIRLYESQLKEQLLIIENLNESREIQNKRINRLIKAMRDFKLGKGVRDKKRYLHIIFDTIQDIEEYSKCHK